MTTRLKGRTRSWPTQRWALWGFMVGFAITVPATFFALVFLSGEALHRYLVPGTVLLRPLSDDMAAWPGLINVTIASVANGLLYAAVAGVVAAVLHAVRRRP